MLIVLTKPAFEFAEAHEGPDALRASAEREIERVFGNPSHIDDWVIHIFSWHGIDNIVINRIGEVLTVDLVEDDDGALEIPLDPKGDLEPDAIPIPSAKD